MAESLSGRHKDFASKKSFILIVIVVLISLISLSSVRADDTLVGGNGSNIMPIKSKDIRMDYEKVVVHMEDYTPHEIGLFIMRRAFVRCLFVLKNTSRKAIKAQVSFPGGMMNDPNTELHAFKATVNNIEKDVRHQQANLAEQSGESEYDSWYTWDVIFPPLKKTIIKNSYWVTLSTDYSTWWFNYVLVTGANWKGNIGKAIIEVIYPSGKDLKNRVEKIEPVGYKIKGNKIYWVFHDFKPTKDIYVEEEYFGDIAEIETDSIKIPLIKAVSLGITDTVKKYLIKGSKINAQDNGGNTALMIASDKGYTDIVKILLAHGAKVNTHNKMGMTALINAAYRGYINIIKILLTHGANVNAKPQDGITALMYASSFGNEDIVKLLLQHKADANAKDNDGWTALKYAEMQRRADIVNLLKAAGAK